MLGDPTGTRDRSEIVATFSFEPQMIIAPQARLVFAQLLGQGENRDREFLVPTLQVFTVSHDADFEYELFGGHDDVSFGVRTETRIDDRRYFSAAPVTTDRHIALLSQLDSLLAPPTPEIP